jgi:RNA polymerase sigma-70 factor (ECF subfamily)
MAQTGLDCLPDDALIEQFLATRAGDSLDELFRRHRAKIYARCLRIVRRPPEAEDLTQETFMRAFAKLASFEGGVFEAWLITIARNVCLNHLRSQFPQAPAGPGAEPAAPPNPADPFAARVVRSILNQLSAPQRTVVKLFHVSGHSYTEIARMTGLSVKEVKTHLQNGRRRFRLLWNEQAEVR